MVGDHPMTDVHVHVHGDGDVEREETSRDCGRCDDLARKVQALDRRVTILENRVFDDGGRDKVVVDESTADPEVEGWGGEYPETPPGEVWSCPDCGVDILEGHGKGGHKSSKCPDPSDVLTCPYCGLTKAEGEAMHRHVKEHHKEEDGYAYRCDVCGRVFDTRFSFGCHVSNHDTDGMVRPFWVSLATLIPADDDTGGDDTGDDGGVVSDDAPDRIEKDRREKGMAISRGHMCGECGRGFDSADSLRVHREEKH